MAVIRIVFMKMEESPKWLVTQGQYEKAVESLRKIAKVNKRQLTITADDFQSMPEETKHKVNDKAITHVVHVKGLVATKKLTLSLSGLIVLWMCIGIA